MVLVFGQPATNAALTQEVRCYILKLSEAEF